MNVEFYIMSLSNIIYSQLSKTVRCIYNVAVKALSLN